jgi:hypothetical protein
MQHGSQELSAKNKRRVKVENMMLMNDVNVGTSLDFLTCNDAHIHTYIHTHIISKKNESENTFSNFDPKL